MRGCLAFFLADAGVALAEGGFFVLLRLGVTCGVLPLVDLLGVAWNCGSTLATLEFLLGLVTAMDEPSCTSDDLRGRLRAEEAVLSAEDDEGVEREAAAA